MIDINAINNESEYRAALKEIESLMKAMPDTPDGKRLVALTTLVEAYEKNHHPINIISDVQISSDPKHLE